MSLPALDNLVRIGQLKPELRNDLELKRMLDMARSRLADARLDSLSREGRFASAYNAAHAAALALRWHGYRSENRYTVFQCLTHTVGWPANRWRVLDSAHQKKEIWPSTRATWRLRNLPSKSCAHWCRVSSLMCRR